MNLLSGKVTATGAQTTIALDGGGTAVSTVPTTDADMGMAVNVGVRPEDFVVAEGEAIYEGSVNLTEALGEVTLLYFKADPGKDPVIGKLPGIHGDLRGNSVRLTAAPEKVQVFHNGESLRYR